ncbi:hypothetical protein [Burkholderia sp. Bp8963]|uniref:hypothetical protein n=1 Tax=Burkholderia sp. Bp8963 TaxID=2184547 RepID=UPI000F5A6239|nr:hypothetical protein [Burkholderia sp. Bp8963]
MDTSAIDQLAQSLKEFLLAQFNAPPGTSHTLAFLGTGVAVQPESFLSDGQFNPARINHWLSVVADPLALVLRPENLAQATPWTATTLMEALATQAQSLAAPDSDEQKGFQRARSQAAENLGGDTSVATAPLDWYDPAQLPQWPHCILQTGQTQVDRTDTGPDGPGERRRPPELPPMQGGVRPPLWAWRTMAAVHVEDSDQFVSRFATVDQLHLPPGLATQLLLNQPLHVVAAAAAPAAASSPPSLSEPIAILRQPIAMRASLAAARIASSSIVESVPAHPVPTVERPVSALLMPQAIQAAVTATAPATRAPLAIQSVPRARINALQAFEMSQAICAAADTASTQTVAANAFSLDMRYRVVELSRLPWWSELLLTLANWCVPGMERGALVAEATADRMTGLPVALLLTSDVKLESDWSESDRTAASSSTHFGPWILNGASFSSSTQTGKAVMAIPGIQVIGCIYRELPALPPCAAAPAIA